MKLQSLSFVCISSVWVLLSSSGIPHVQPATRPAGDQKNASTQSESQPAPARSGRPQEQDRNPDHKRLEIQINQDALRDRLNRSIIRSQQILERSKAALEKLDAGASPSEVLSDMKIEGIAHNPVREPQPAPNADNGRPGGPNPEGNPANKRSLTPEDREELHAFLQVHFPDLWKSLEQVIGFNPRSADSLLVQIAPQIREIMYLRDTQPELASIKIEEMQIGLAFVDSMQQYRQVMNTPESSASEKADALTTLRELAAQRFDVQLRAKQFEIQQLEARLDELKGSVDEILSRRQDEIERVVNAAMRNPRNRTRENTGSRRDGSENRNKNSGDD